MMLLQGSCGCLLSASFPSKPLYAAVGLSSDVCTSSFSAPCRRPLQWRSPGLTVSFPKQRLASSALAAAPSPELEAEAGDEEQLEVKELEDLPEQWRRSKVAWLCKEVPSHRHATFTRLLNAQRKWITQQDLTYIVVHLLRIRNNDAAFRVYNWMTRQHWFRFSLPLATKLADCLAKDRKHRKCRDVFDSIIRGGRVPAESTFHSLIIAYLSAPEQDESLLNEACVVYNLMIQKGGYRPSLSLHNSLLRAIVSRPGVEAKRYLSQGEFVFSNIETSGLEIQRDVYAGLIWLHSYQDTVDRRRIAVLRQQMRQVGLAENADVLVSVLRACSKDGDQEQGERAWEALLRLGEIPSQAFVYKMELYAKAGDPMKSLEVFRSIEARPPNLVAYQKIIEVMTGARETGIAESLVTQLVDSGLKPLVPSFVALMEMYLALEMYDQVESAFQRCVSLVKSPNRSVYRIYLVSLVRGGRLERAEEVFAEMNSNVAIGASAGACNIMLGGYLSAEEHSKAEKVCEMMLQNKFEIEPAYLEKIQHIIGLKKRMAMKRPVRLTLSGEQREILMGLFLGGLQIGDTDGKVNGHAAILFEFKEKSPMHSVLKSHVHEVFREWLPSQSEFDYTDASLLPWKFQTVRHISFDFFVNQFFSKAGRLTVPKLMHRWATDRVLAYWYMYAGGRIADDILLKLKSRDQEDMERVVRCLVTRGLECHVKRKGRLSWFALRGVSAQKFWEVIEPYVLAGVEEAMGDESSDEKSVELEAGFGGPESEADSDAGYDSAGGRDSNLAFASCAACNGSRWPKLSMSGRNLGMHWWMGQRRVATSSSLRFHAHITAAASRWSHLASQDTVSLEEEDEDDDDEEETGSEEEEGEEVQEEPCTLLAEIEPLLTAEEKSILFENERPNMRKVSSPKWQPLQTLALSGQIRIMGTLINECGYGIDEADKDGYTALHKAIIGKKEAVISHLIRKGANPDVRDRHGATPLHHAAQVGALQTVKLLIKYKADVNAADNDGWTPLHVAIQSRSREIAKVLLVNGADGTRRNHDGKSPLDIALCFGRDFRSYELTKLLKAIPGNRNS